MAATAKRLLAFEGKPTDKAPPFYSCEWRWRAEQFGPDNARIKQWTLRDEPSAQKVYEYLRTLFAEYVLPRAVRMTREADLLERSGGFSYPQLKTKAILAATENDPGELRKAVSALLDEFGQGVAATGVQEHIQKMRTRFPEQCAKSN